MQRSTAEINAELHADKIERLNRERVKKPQAALESVDSLDHDRVEDRPTSKDEYTKFAAAGLKRLMRNADIAAGEE